jgi:hypothetical protein
MEEPPKPPGEPPQNKRSELLQQEALRLELERRRYEPPPDYREVRRSANASFGVGKILVLLLIILGGLCLLKLASVKLGLG